MIGNGQCEEHKEITLSCPHISTWHRLCWYVSCGVLLVPPPPSRLIPALLHVSDTVPAKSPENDNPHAAFSRLFVGLAPRRPRPSSAKLAALVLFTGAALAIARPAAAQQFKVTATGTITSIDNYEGLLNSSVAVGTPFTSSFLFDYSAPNQSSGNPNIGSYNLEGANFGVTSMFGDYTFAPGPESNGVGIYLNEGGGLNRLILQSQSGTATGFSVPVRPYDTSIQVYDYAGLLSSTALPSLSTYGTFPLSDQIFFSVGFNTNSTSIRSRVNGSVTSLSAQLVNPDVAPVPEASTTVSLGVLLGLGGLVLAVRRRKLASR